MPPRSQSDRLCRVRLRRASARAQAGFTLVELVVVMAIVGILAAVAIPMYQSQVQRGHRASAQAVLLDAATRQRQFLIDQRAYASTLTELGLTVPATLSSRYVVTVEAQASATPPTFKVLATPAGTQTSDKCSVLSVDQAGARLPASCW